MSILNIWRAHGGGPPYRKIGGAVRYDPGEVLRWIDGNVRVWEKGAGRTVGVLGGLFGFPRWSPFLEPS